MIFNDKYQSVVTEYSRIGEDHKQYMFDCFRNREFPLVLWRNLAKAGLFKVSAEGKREHALRYLAAAYEGLARGSGDLAFGIATICHGALAVPILSRFAPERKTVRKYLADAISGKSIISFAVTENVSGGTDAYHSDCRLTTHNGVKILNGKKWHITSAPYADLIMAWAMDDYDSLVAVLVDAKQEGVIKGKLIPCAAARTSPVGPIEFRNVEIAPDCILRFRNGKRALTDALIDERVIGTFAGVGCIKQMIDKCVYFLRNRKLNGVKLERHQYMQHRITRMQFLLTRLEALSHGTLNLLAEGHNVDLESSVLKPTAADAVFECAREAGQICASYGLQEESQFYSALLDSWGAMIGGGTEEAHRMIVWNKMKRRYQGKSLTISSENVHIWEESESLLEEIKSAI